MKPILALFTSFAVSIAVASAAPWPIVTVPKITGTVVAFTWIGGFHYQQEEVWHIVNPTGMSESDPTYYLLLNKTNLTKKQREELTEYSRNTNFRPKIFSRGLEKDELIIMVESHRVKEMMVGATIELHGYDIRADEFTSWSKHTDFLLNGKKPTEGKQDGDDAEVSPNPENKAAEQALDNPLPVPSRSLRVATNLNLKRRGAPGSGCQASTLGKNHRNSN